MAKALLAEEQGELADGADHLQVSQRAETLELSQTDNLGLHCLRR